MVHIPVADHTWDTCLINLKQNRRARGEKCARATNIVPRDPEGEAAAATPRGRQRTDAPCAGC